MWQLEFNGPMAEVAQRVVEVGGYPVVLSQGGSGAGLVSAAAQTFTIYFDTLTSSDILFKVPNGYSDLNWHNWIATHYQFYGGHGYVNATPSGEYVAYNSSGHPAAMSSAEPFDFISVYIAVAWNKGERGFIELKKLRGDKLVCYDQVSATTAGPIPFQADYADVTRVEFSTRHYWQVILDDLPIGRRGLQSQNAAGGLPTNSP